MICQVYISDCFWESNRYSFELLESLSHQTELETHSLGSVTFSAFFYQTSALPLETVTAHNSHRHRRRQQLNRETSHFLTEYQAASFHLSVASKCVLALGSTPSTGYFCGQESRSTIFAIIPGHFPCHLLAKAQLRTTPVYKVRQQYGNVF